MPHHMVCIQVLDVAEPPLRLIVLLDDQGAHAFRKVLVMSAVRGHGHLQPEEIRERHARRTPELFDDDTD